MMARLRLEHGNDEKTFKVVRGNMRFACKIPLYTSDDQGRPTVQIWDCEQGITRTYSQAAWEQKMREEI
jgi:hypothetical protein